MSLDSILRATGKNLLPNPNVHTYNYSSDYKKYNNTDEIFLTAGTYSVSVSANCPTLQFWNVTTKQQYTVDEAVSAYSTNTYYKIYEGYALGRASDAVRQMWFTLKINALITLNSANTNATSQECQIEKGSTATTYEPYEYLGPKTIKMGDKEVLKVSYNSRNFFNVNTLASSVGITKSITNNTITFTSTAVNGRYVYKIPTQIGKQYTVSVKSLASVPTSGQSATGSDIFLGSTANPDTGDYGSITSTALTKTFTATTKFLYIKQYVCYGANQVGGQKIIEELQVELGNKKTDYVPYFNTVVWTQVLTGYNITSTTNADGTQSLSIVDATSTTDHYNITSTDNSDGTQTLNITDA